MGQRTSTTQTYRLTQERAALGGESAAVAEHEPLEELRGEHRGGLAQRLLAIGRDCAPCLKEPWLSADHGDLLYDQRGLPR